jgi:hypothetical protein
MQQHLQQHPSWHGHEERLRVLGFGGHLVAAVARRGKGRQRRTWNFDCAGDSLGVGCGVMENDAKLTARRILCSLWLPSHLCKNSNDMHKPVIEPDSLTNRLSLICASESRKTKRPSRVATPKFHDRVWQLFVLSTTYKSVAVGVNRLSRGPE